MLELVFKKVSKKHFNLLCETLGFLQIDQPDFQFPTEWNNQTKRTKFNSQVQLNII